MTRATLLLGACLLCLSAPAGVADATTDAATENLLNNPQVCGPAGDDPVAGAPVADMVMVEGFGTGGFPVDTASPEAQAWFDHGVRLRWAFEHTESVRAFQKARLLDPDCGMCAWGEAWAMGPNLNGGGSGDTVAKSALGIAREARRLARDATPIQKMMIDALIQRYSGRADRRAARFSRAMERIAARAPDDVAVANITADSLLLVDYDWWTEDGKPKNAYVPRAMTLLEHALAVRPDDPGAIHLYIHLTEWSDDPHKAIPYGERLAALAPGASHLVHMPSHTFYRVGRYRDAMMSNVNAVALDRRYNALARPPGGVSAMPLHGHNIHFGMGGALMAGGAEQGIALADWFLETYPALLAVPSRDEGSRLVWRQYQAFNAYALYGRYAEQDRVAGLPEPDAGRPLMRVGWRYALGEAAARRGDHRAVSEQAEAIAAIRGSGGFSGRQGEDMNEFAELAQRVLEGRAAMLAGDAAAAVIAFSQAAELQGKSPEGGDPPVVWYPTRRSLAAALLASGDASSARSKILELLEDWPNDPYSYFVLSEAESALGDPTASEAAASRAAAEWLGGAMSLPLA